MNINCILATDLNIREDQVERTIELIDAGNTIPFISRYRKEVTGNLSDTILRKMETKLAYLRTLQQRQQDVIRLIGETGKLDKETKDNVLNAATLQEVEDIYLPFRPKKRTRATMAREKGLEPLADLIENTKATRDAIEQKAVELIHPENGIMTKEDALQGAMDILAERIAETKCYRDIVRKDGYRNGMLHCRRLNDTEDTTYEMYYDYSESIKEVKPHRILAMNRGEKEGILKIKIQLQDDLNIKHIRFYLVKDESSPRFSYLDQAVRDSYKRLMLPSIETEIRSELKKKADQESIQVFAGNLKPYLMQSPIRGRVIMGIDPGYRTGCKLAVISEYGIPLAYDTIYPTKPKEKIHEAKALIKKLTDKFNVTLIAIGNGTASRETEQLIAQIIYEMPSRELHYTIVNESGASIYSASQLGNEEFPNLDVTIRGAVSIARRIQDPLAELVKIEPRHIGVGQYQHDVNQKELALALSNVVEDCVNSVGVDVNTASWSLLSYVAGISKTVAKNIVNYKEENGPFRARNELNQVKGLGPKAFTQCAGFLRIPNAGDVLDNTGVHPESYCIARQLIGLNLNKININEKARELQVGSLTLSDIIQELQKPGRDPREDMPKPILRSDVLSIDDLQEGMEMKGTVRNVVDFGAFVDIGIKNDGLVHVSEISNKFIKHPKELLKISDVVTVRIIGIDKKKGKVSLSMKGLKQQ